MRRRVLAGIKSVERGEYEEYAGPEGLENLASNVKARARATLAERQRRRG